jgi:hypothetical protein
MIEFMKVKTIIVLTAIAFSVLSPLSLHLVILHGQTSFEVFDVCHAATPAIASNGEVPCLNEAPCHPCRPEEADVARIEMPFSDLLCCSSGKNVLRKPDFHHPHFEYRSRERFRAKLHACVRVFAYRVHYGPPSL